MFQQLPAGESGSNNSGHVLLLRAVSFNNDKVCFFYSTGFCG